MHSGVCVRTVQWVDPAIVSMCVSAVYLHCVVGGPDYCECV